MFTSQFAPVLLESSKSRLLLDFSKERGLREVSLPEAGFSIVEALVVDIISHDLDEVKILGDSL